jgi:hypothetical protein
MAMPKASVNKNDLSVPLEDDIRAPSDVNRMEAIAVPKPPQDPSDREFRPCVLTPDQRHLTAALAFRQRIQSRHHESADGPAAMSFGYACVRVPSLPMHELSET